MADTDGLYHEACRLFPDVARIPLEATWAGRVAMTADHLPHVRAPGDEAYAERKRLWSTDARGICAPCSSSLGTRSWRALSGTSGSTWTGRSRCRNKLESNGAGREPMQGSVS